MEAAPIVRMRLRGAEWELSQIPFETSPCVIGLHVDVRACARVPRIEVDGWKAGVLPHQIPVVDERREGRTCMVLPTRQREYVSRDPGGWMSIRLREKLPIRTSTRD